MTIEEIRSRKQRLNRELVSLINDFERETDVSVRDIQLERFRTDDGKGYVTAVRVELDSL